MKTRNVAAFALGAAVVAVLLAYPAFASVASTNGSPTTTSGSATAAGAMAPGNVNAGAPNELRPGPAHWADGRGQRGGARGNPATTFSNGQTITLTSTKGAYFIVGTNGKTNGTASGTLTFTVTGKVTSGYVLNVGGNLNVNGTTYSVTSGSAAMGSGANGIQGQGATSSSGSFMLRASARGDFSGTTTAMVSVDFSNGTTEYAVFLTSTIQG